MRNNKLKAMTFLEYTMLTIIIVAAIVGMQTYLKRAISERWRQSADVFGFGRVAASAPAIGWEK